MQSSTSILLLGLARLMTADNVASIKAHKNGHPSPAKCCHLPELLEGLMTCSRDANIINCIVIDDTNPRNQPGNLISANTL